MLSQILNLLRTGQSYSVQQLAEHLNTTSEIIQSSIEYLERLGYIRKAVIASTCSKGCRNCHGCDVKRLSPISTMWEIKHL